MGQVNRECNSKGLSVTSGKNLGVMHSSWAPLVTVANAVYLLANSLPAVKKGILTSGADAMKHLQARFTKFRWNKPIFKFNFSYNSSAIETT